MLAGSSCRSESITTTASPRGVGQAGLHGGLVAEVAGEVQHADPRVARRERVEDLGAAVASSRR